MKGEEKHSQRKMPFVDKFRPTAERMAEIANAGAKEVVNMSENVVGDFVEIEDATDDGGMGKWKATVQAHSSGDGIIPIPPAVVKNSDFRSGDVFLCENQADGAVVLRRAVRVTSLIREWNKYQRRVENTKQRFVVLRNGEPIAEIGPEAKNEVISVTEQQYNKFTKILETDPRLNERLRELLARKVPWEIEDTAQDGLSRDRSGEDQGRETFD